MKKINFEKKADDLRKDVNENKTVQEENGEIYIDGKICPFRGDAKHQVACTPQCKLHRADKKGFECIFSELAPISWSLKNK